MKWFREQGHEMILVAPDDGTLYMRCKEDGFKVISIYFTKPRTLLNILKMLWIIWRLKPNVVATHSSTDSWAGLVAAYCLSVKKRIRYRHVCTPVSANFINRIQYERLLTNVITTGCGTRLSLLHDFKIDENKIMTIPTAVKEVRNLLPKHEAITRLQKELCLHPKTFFIGQVSVLRGLKGHSVLFDAFEEIADNYSDVHLIVVGDGGMKNKLMKHKESLKNGNRIHMIGFKSNTYDYLRAFECLVLPSLKDEGIPQCLSQSMYAKVPIIASRVRGITDIIDDGVTGLLCEAGDSLSLKDCFLKLISNEMLKEEITNSAQRKVKDFTWDKLGALTVKFFASTST